MLLINSSRPNMMLNENIVFGVSDQMGLNQTLQLHRLAEAIVDINTIDARV